MGDLAISYIAATALCLCLEMPISALQKLIIPDNKTKLSRQQNKKRNDLEKLNNGTELLTNGCESLSVDTKNLSNEDYKTKI